MKSCSVILCKPGMSEQTHHLNSALEKESKPTFLSVRKGPYKTFDFAELPQLNYLSITLYFFTESLNLFFS